MNTLKTIIYTRANPLGVNVEFGAKQTLQYIGFEGLVSDFQDLVCLVNEEMASLSGEGRKRVLIIEGEQREVESRLDRPYVAPEPITAAWISLAYNPRVHKVRFRYGVLLEPKKITAD